jgi:hypothetical protein
MSRDPIKAISGSASSAWMMPASINSAMRRVSNRSRNVRCRSSKISASKSHPILRFRSELTPDCPRNGRTHNALYTPAIHSKIKTVVTATTQAHVNLCRKKLLSSFYASSSESDERLRAYSRKRVISLVSRSRSSAREVDRGATARKKELRCFPGRCCFQF